MRSSIFAAFAICTLFTVACVSGTDDPGATVRIQGDRAVVSQPGMATQDIGLADVSLLAPSGEPLSLPTASFTGGAGGATTNDIRCAKCTFDPEAGTVCCEGCVEI